ncbi:GlmU family protein [Hyphobacterium sp. CCMP332]|nr:GlmU family protein [Hyphobacterium sp. CCMP332]
MTIVLFDHEDIRADLLPLTYTRPIADIRCGILTIREKWQKSIAGNIHVICAAPLDRFLNKPLPKGPKLYINASVLPGKELIEKINELNDSQGLQCDDILIAYKSTENLDSENLSTKNMFEESEYFGQAELICNSWDIFKFNASQIKSDFSLITEGRKSQPLKDPHSIIYNEENVFIEEGATIKAAIINAENGPIYIGKNATVEEGAIIRGSFALCEGSFVNTGAKIRGDSTIGPYSKAGGEISNSVIFGYSNKGHDGFLGNSVIGEWCNIGADTNTSNLKNNYDEVKLWNYSKERFIKTGEQFCGLIMADHSKCGINTMFNTGTSVGVGANIFGSGFPANFIPSFFWGGPQGKATFTINKMLETARIVMSRRNKTLDKTNEDILEMIFRSTKKYRNWE